MKNLIAKIDRVASWILFVVVIAYAITGFGMTKGLVDSELSHNWHLGYLGAVGLIAFVIHTAHASYLVLKRKNICNVFTKWLLVIFYLFLIFFFCYLQFFYQGSRIKKEISIGNEVKNTQTENISNKTVFTAETLQQYNGLNGKPAYIAVSGVVYDVSSLFKNGQHKGCNAGQDVTRSLMMKNDTEVKYWRGIRWLDYIKANSDMDI